MEGTRLGPYQIDRELGAGGMGMVYAATVVQAVPDLEPGTRVAIKVVHKHLLEQPGYRERFVREARSGLAIESSNVVRTIECVEMAPGANLSIALVLEFVDGKDLAALLAETRRVPEDLCRHVAREIALGLQAIHAAGIVHRDLKPGNVMLTTAGGVKVMDFGLARQASGADRMSQTGLFLGTAAYAPPEQFFGKRELDARSDLYSLGAMLFELATGRVPFEAERLGDLMRSVLRDQPPRIGAAAPQVSPFFEEVVATLLHKEPSRRFASAAELGSVLDAGEESDWWAAAAARVCLESGRPLRRVRVPAEAELWGREHDLAELRELWERAKLGRGAVALLEGEAGIGKTRLVEELLGTIEVDRSATILFARELPGGAQSASAGLAAAVREHLATEGLDDRLRELLPEAPRLVPALSAFLRGAAPAPEAAPMTQGALATLLVHLLTALADEAPLVLVVDDLHFATDDERALFRAVALAVECSPLLLVGTAREGLPSSWLEDLAGRSNVVRRRLERLDDATVRAALTRRLGGGWEAESVAELVASRAGGNPYFVVEVLRHLGAQGSLARAPDGGWRVVTVPGDIAIPRTLREVVALRLRALVPHDLEILESASCQGHEFDARLVSQSLGRSRLEVLRALGRLEATSSLVRAAGTRFRFDHHLVQEVLYDGLSPERRCALHATIADALEHLNETAARDPEDVGGPLSVELAEHLLRGGEGARALRYLGVAQRHLHDTYSNARGVSLAQAALALPGLLSGARRAWTLIRLCAPYQRLGLRAEQEQAAREAEREATAAGAEMLRIEGAANVAWCLNVVARHDEAEAAFRRALASARALGDQALIAHLEGDVGVVLSSQGRLAEARVHIERQIAIAREIGDRAEECSGLGNLGVALLGEGRLAEARAQLEGQLAISREIGDRDGEARASGNLGTVLLADNRIAEAAAAHERALFAFREIGDRMGEARCLCDLGAVQHVCGRVAEARESHRRSVALAHALAYPRGEAVASYSLGAVQSDLGETSDAEQSFARCLAISVEIDDRPLAAAAHLALGALHAAAGEDERARAELEAACALGAASGSAAAEVMARCELACLAGGDSGAAIATFVEHDGRLEPSEVVEARLLLWRATGDRAHLAAAKCLLDESVAGLPEEHRESVLTNLRINREIVAAWRAEFGDDDPPHGTGSVAPVVPRD